MAVKALVKVEFHEGEKYNLSKILGCFCAFPGGYVSTVSDVNSLGKTTKKRV